jgi:transglutaminase-like putative cysteine protease
VELRTRTHAPHTRLLLDAAIAHPERVVRLTLAADARTRAALGVDPAEDALVVDNRRGRPVTPAARTAALGESVALPVSSPEIRALLERAPRAGDSLAQVDLLLAFVRQSLDYDEAARTFDLGDALRSGRGDCTEFADLFTTLARALDIPARPVNGLVYAEIDGPGFYVHAWSEVALDGQWVAVDPTSGQRPADATHVPFPDDATGFLRAYAALADMRLEVVDVEYQ